MQRELKKLRETQNNKKNERYISALPAAPSPAGVDNNTDDEGIEADTRSVLLLGLLVVLFGLKRCSKALDAFTEDRGLCIALR